MKSISFGPPRVLPNSFGLPKYPWNTTSIDRVILPYLRDIFKCVSKTQIVKMTIVAITMILIYHASNTLWVAFTLRSFWRMLPLGGRHTQSARRSPPPPSPLLLLLLLLLLQVPTPKSPALTCLIFDPFLTGVLLLLVWI